MGEEGAEAYSDMVGDDGSAEGKAEGPATIPSAGKVALGVASGIASEPADGGRGEMTGTRSKPVACSKVGGGEFGIGCGGGAAE